MPKEAQHIIAIIPARGGSKRIPHKNIRLFCEKPVLAYSISAALESELFQEIMISTDNLEIANLAQSLGARVPFLRSGQTSSDFATTEAVITEVLHQYLKNGICFDYYCCLYATAPFVTPERLRNAFAQMVSSGASFLTPVVRYSSPPQRSRAIRNGKLEMAWPEYKDTRTQDLEPLYHDSGQFYFGRTDDFFQYGMAGRNVLPLVLPENEVQDIDTEADWKLAEIKFHLLHPKQNDSRGCK